MRVPRLFVDLDRKGDGEGRAFPSSDSTQIVPPCISTMRLAIDRPSPVPPFFLVVELSACWNSSKILAWSASEMPGPVSRTATVNAPLAADALDRDLARVGELDRVADEVEQDLGEAALVAARHAAGSAAIPTFNARFFCAASGSTARQHGVHDLLDRVVGERKRELPGLDLGQVEHVVDQPEQVLAVALDALEHGCASSAAPRRRCRRG